jgi:hypothetical protein
VSTILKVNGIQYPELLVANPGPTLDPAQPQIQWLSIAGGVDIDVTGVLSGGWPEYSHTHCAVPLAAFDQTLWEVKDLYIPMWHGRTIKLAWQEYPGRYLRGRASLRNWSWPSKQDAVTFTLDLDADPYWWADTVHSQNVNAAASPGASIALAPTGYPVMPVTTITGGAVTLVVGSSQIQLAVGTYQHIDALMLSPDVGPLAVKVIGAASSKATFTWQEGWLT